MSTLPIVFSKSDIVSSMELPADWYPLEIKSVTSGPGKKDPNSITWNIKFEVIGGGKYDGVPVQIWPSSKALGQAATLIKCFGEPQQGKQYNLEELVGQKVQGYCFFKDDGEFRNNQIKDFRPIDSK